MVPDDHQDDKTRSHVVLTNGTEVSHYRIIDKIGAGGMGEVYLAEDTQLKRQVALKFLPPHLCQDEDCRARFKREARAAANLDHPNIVTIHEVSEYKGRPFFAMQHVEGSSLRDLIKGIELSLEKVISLAIQVCEGLGKAHQAGIIHRDIKPSNIVIDSDGRPKLVDFGLAAIQGTDKLTKTGSTLGTTGYMSPEQIQVKEVDQRSDLFSFGVMLYQMIAGRMPFKGDTEAAILNSVLNDTPEPLSRYKSGVSGDLQRIVTKLLEKDPELRYQSAAGVISDLRRLSVDTDVAGKPRKDWWNRYIVVGASAIILAMAGYWLISQFDSDQIDEPVSERKTLAVLPFENLGAPEDEYFADGITDEITSRLAGINGLGVISRTSAMQYKNTDKGLREIGRELGVDYVLEGTIRWDKSGDTSRVRILPQLIRAADDLHLWADNYERALTQIFAVQADIANKIAEALDIALLEPERRSLEVRPTENLEAHDYFLRGNQYLGRSYEEEDFRIAIEMYEKAIALDPGFALAYAELSFAHVELYWFYYDHTEDRLRMAREAVERALELQPDLPEAHGALAMYYYHGFLDYEQAIREAEIALKKQPNNDELYGTIAAIKRRQGKWEEAIRNYRRQTELNPRDGIAFFEFALTHASMRDYQQAERLFDMAISLSPDLIVAYIFKSEMYLTWKGDVGEARRVLERAAGKVDIAQLTYAFAICDILDRDYETALDRFSSFVLPPFGDSVDYYFTKANIYRLMNDTVLSSACYDSVLVLCEARLADGSDSLFSHIRSAYAYAFHGNKENAIRLAQMAVEMWPISKDALTGASMLEMLAEIYVVVGEYDAGLEQIEYLLSIPSELSVLLLHLDPKWDALRDHPRFQALLEKHSKQQDAD